MEVTPTDRPADTATTTTVEMIELVGGIPTQAWMPRDLTAEEIEAANASTVSLALAEGMAADEALVKAAITPDQFRYFARQVLRLTRLQTGDLSSADVGDDTA